MSTTTFFWFDCMSVAKNIITRAYGNYPRDIFYIITKRFSDNLMALTETIKQNIGS